MYSRVAPDNLLDAHGPVAVPAACGQDGGVLPAPGQAAGGPARLPGVDDQCAVPVSCPQFLDPDYRHPHGLGNLPIGHPALSFLEYYPPDFGLVQLLHDPDPAPADMSPLLRTPDYAAHRHFDLTPRRRSGSVTSAWRGVYYFSDYRGSGRAPQSGRRYSSMVISIWLPLLSQAKMSSSRYGHFIISETSPKKLFRSVTDGSAEPPGWEWTVPT